MDDPGTPFPYPLGALESPPDDRDWPIDGLYALAGLSPDAAFPAVYRAALPRPSQLIQIGPTCVPYGDAWLKQFEDLRDTGPFTPNIGAFFAAIGGSPAGADPRRALQELVDVGYPSPTSAASLHRIDGYYAVPVTEAAIKAAIMAFGPVGFSVLWSRSWFNPGPDGTLPPPTIDAAGHYFAVDGWDARGARIIQTWGPGWGDGGLGYLPFAYLGKVRNVWKLVDHVNKLPPPPKPRTYHLHIAHGAKVRTYLLTGGRLTDQRDLIWRGQPSGAPCRKPAIELGKRHGRATVAFCTGGEFVHRYVRIGTGVTITAS